jgi:DNA-binding MarR family transcriptional regulator
VTWLDRLFRRPPGQPAAPVELDLYQQHALLTLKRAGPCAFDRLYAEVSAIRPTTQAEMVNAILKLEAAGVLERLPDGPQSRRPYVLTRRGKRITRYLPNAPRSAMQFYV